MSMAAIRSAMRARMRITSIASTLACALLLAAPLTAQRPERPALTISGYVIDAEIDTATHHLAAKAVVTFTAPENSEAVSFGFHPALKVTKISDEAGTVLTGERSPDGGIRITPATPFVRGPGSALDLRVRGHDHRQRRRPHRGLEAGRHSGADHLSALSGALVSHRPAT